MQMCTMDRMPWILTEHRTNKNENFIYLLASTLTSSSSSYLRFALHEMHVSVWVHHAKTKRRQEQHRDKETDR